MNVLKIMIFQVQFIFSRNEEVIFKWAASSVPSSLFLFKVLEKINSGQAKNFFLYKFIQYAFELVRKGKERNGKERDFKDKY